jgi:hypothetical protein
VQPVGEQRRVRRQRGLHAQVVRARLRLVRLGRLVLQRPRPLGPTGQAWHGHDRGHVRVCGDTDRAGAEDPQQPRNNGRAVGHDLRQLPVRGRGRYCSSSTKPPPTLSPSPSPIPNPTVALTLTRRTPSSRAQTTTFRARLREMWSPLCARRSRPDARSNPHPHPHPHPHSHPHPHPKTPSRRGASKSRA